MLKKVKFFMEKHHMIEEGGRIVAGVSGGADSVCLLLLLAKLRENMSFSLEAVHVEHGIRGAESLADAEFTEELCRNLKIPCRRYTVNAVTYAEETGESLEEAARELRYDCFRRACAGEPAAKVAIAHHGDDSAETMLFHLARGTGIRGLSGIAPVMDMGGIQVIRPLLCLTREEIEAWLEEREQPWCTDVTNGDVTYSRNRIRSQVLPGLKLINNQAVLHMTETARQLREICAYLDEAALQAGQGAYEIIEIDEKNRQIRVFCEAFHKIAPVLQTNLLHQLIGMLAGSRKDITSGHVEQVRQLFFGEVGRRISLPRGITAERTYETVDLFFVWKEKEKEAALQPFCRMLAIPGETLCGNGMRFRVKVMDFDGNFEKIPEKRYTKWFDYDKIKNTVWLRTRRPGDYLQSDREGGHKKLKRYFIDEKIPAKDRDQILLLTEESHVLWVIGHRISEAYKVDRGTKRVLCVQCVNRFM